MARWADIKFPMSAMLTAGVAIWLMLSGCAPLSNHKCLDADWFSIGYEDGARGYGSARIEEHRKVCTMQGVSPDAQAYEKGRQKGLIQWCAPANGHRIGLQGGRYNGVCPGDLESAFRKAINQGKAIFAYVNAIRKQDQRIMRLYADLDGMDKGIKAMDSELAGDSVSPRRRKALLEEIQLRQQDRRQLRDDISAEEKTLSDMRNYLEGLKARSPYQ